MLRRISIYYNSSLLSPSCPNLFMLITHDTPQTIHLALSLSLSIHYHIQPPPQLSHHTPQPSSHRIPHLLRPPGLLPPHPPPKLLPPPTQEPHRDTPRRIPLQTNISTYQLTPFVLSAFESLDLFVGKGRAVREIRGRVAEFGREGRYGAEGGFAFRSCTKDWFRGGRMGGR
jgi:hypothetical protein